MKPGRMLYFDNLRLTVIVLVVCMHVAVTYSGLGSWYYKEQLQPGMGTIVTFAVFQCFLQAFFMGALFMVAGYFAAGSLKSKGAGAFIKGRVSRLGLPTLTYMLAVHPLSVYYLADFDHTRFTMPFTDFYLRYVISLKFLSGTGPMWFALVLLIFCVVYALAFSARRSLGAAGQDRTGPVMSVSDAGDIVTGGIAVRIALLASISAFAIRIVQPIGTDIMNMQLCYFAQYIILFIFGIMAHGRGWFDTLDYRLSKRLVLLAFLFIPLLPLLFVVGGVLTGNKQAMFGGPHWQSLAFSTWESFTGVFLSIGLLGVFKQKWNNQGSLISTLSGASFAVYMFHAPVLIFISQMLRPVHLAALPKFLLVLAVALPASFLTGIIVRRIPVLRQLTPS